MPRLSAIAFSFVALVHAACTDPAAPGPSAPAGVALSSITVTSKSFPSAGAIPVDYTCDGKGVSPQLTWSAPPETTKSLVVVLDDPDASSGRFTHWVVLGLPSETLSLSEGVDVASVGAKLGANDFHNVHYDGPCPPHGEEHRYQVHVYAVDTVLKLEEGAARGDVDAALAGHVVGAGTLTGVFSH